MTPFPAFLAPLLLLQVATIPGNPSGNLQVMDNDADASALALVMQDRFEPFVAGPADNSPIDWLDEGWQEPSANQVSIEQHIIIRVAPQMRSNPDARTRPLAAPYQPVRRRFEERAMAKCVPVAGVAGVQITEANRLVLFLRDNRVVSAGLDKGCAARDFYSGFYVARSADGMICSGRDKLQSRNGASCKLGKLRQLVEAAE